MVHLTAHIGVAGGNFSDIEFEPLQIKSKWQLTASVRQEKEISLTDLTPLGQAELFSIPPSCASASSGVSDKSTGSASSCLEGISARIEFMKESGRKFKLQLIACC
jgi:hypothetical protein